MKALGVKLRRIKRIPMALLFLLLFPPLTPTVHSESNAKRCAGPLITRESDTRITVGKNWSRGSPCQIGPWVFKSPVTFTIPSNWSAGPGYIWATKQAIELGLQPRMRSPKPVTINCGRGPCATSPSFYGWPGESIPLGRWDVSETGKFALQAWWVNNGF
jgi:hypothetical protein